MNMVILAAMMEGLKDMDRTNERMIIHIQMDNKHSGSEGGSEVEVERRLTLSTKKVNERLLLSSSYRSIMMGGRRVEATTDRKLSGSCIFFFV